MRGNTRLLLSRITRDEEMELREDIANAESLGGDEAVVERGKALLVVLAAERLQIAMEVRDARGLQAAITRAEHETLTSGTVLLKEARELLAVLATEELHQGTTQLNLSRLGSALSSFAMVKGVDELVVSKAEAMALQLVRSSRIGLLMRITQPPYSRPLDGKAPIACCIQNTLTIACVCSCPDSRRRRWLWRHPCRTT